MIGTTIGKYHLVGLLGRGATGIVYKAVDSTLDREVAIKVLNPHFAVPDISKRFRAEATILAKLSHPEIATIHELLQTDTDLLMVMELVRGETLECLCSRVGSMSADHAGHLLDGILSALEHAHHAGIVHRDLKPANVMVTQLGGIKIMDFGIARVRGAEHMTIDGCAIGTPAYMPPEQVMGEEIDGRADLYAVGVILYRLLTGTLPFDADTPMAILQKQIAETPAPLHSHREGLPDWCERVVQRALAKSPADRFQSAREFRLAISRATGIAPSIDLAQAFAIGAGDTAAAPFEGTPPETLPLADIEAAPNTASSVVGIGDEKPDSREPAATTTHTVELRPPVVPGRVRTTHFAMTRAAAALLAGIAAVIAIAAYSVGEPFAVGPASTRADSAEVEPTKRAASPGDAGEAPPLASTRPAAQATRRSSRESASGPEERVITAPAPSGPVFRTKIIEGSGIEQREEDGRLSLADGRVTVAPSNTPQDFVFSAPYRGITAIQYSRKPIWKPPEKLSRVIRLGDDVLETFGIRDRHYVSLHTDAEDASVLLRVDERVVSKLLNELKQRTGRTPERISER